jgi:hypothetical protein
MDDGTPSTVDGNHSQEQHQEAWAAIETARLQLVEALRAVWDACETYNPEAELRASGVVAGANLPEELAQALTELARTLGDTERLACHRPGSWEAEHVRRLGALL